MKLVHDADKPEKLDTFNYRDIPACLRMLADSIEKSENAPNSVIVLTLFPEGLGQHVFGDNPTGYELIGALEVAKLGCYEVGRE